MNEQDTFTQLPSPMPNYQDLLQQLLGGGAAAASAPVQGASTTLPVDTQAQAAASPVTTSVPATDASASAVAALPGYSSLAPWIQSILTPSQQATG